MIEIVKYTPSNKGKVIGYIDIRIPKLSLILRHMPIFKDGEKQWIAFPKYYVDETQKYEAYVEFFTTTQNKEFFRRLQEAVELYKKSENEEIIDNIENKESKSI